MIKNKKIAIIGLGYVGLPLAIEFGKKYLFIQEKLNHRPRKKLGYRTPYEVFYVFFSLNP